VTSGIAVPPSSAAFLPVGFTCWLMSTKRCTYVSATATTIATTTATACRIDILKRCVLYVGFVCSACLQCFGGKCEYDTGNVLRQCPD
jgi:hypothetical protein